MSVRHGDLDRLLAARPRFLAFLDRRLGDRALAEDVLQTALLHVIERDGPGPPGDRVMPWFYRVLRNLAIDAQRRRAAAARGAAAYAADPALGPGAPPSAPGAMCPCVGLLVAALRPGYAEALRRVDLGAEAPAAAARALGISRSHLGVRLHRARRTLRERVRQVCGACAAGGCRDCTCTPGRPAARV